MLVARRAALLSGMAVAAVMVQTGRATLPSGPMNSGGNVVAQHPKGEKVVVGFDGRYAA